MSDEMVSIRRLRKLGFAHLGVTEAEVCDAHPFESFNLRKLLKRKKPKAKDIRSQIDRDFSLIDSRRQNIINRISPYLGDRVADGDCTKTEAKKYIKTFMLLSENFKVLFNDRAWVEWYIKILSSEKEPFELHDSFKDFALQVCGSTSRMRVIVYENFLLSIKCIGDEEDLKLMAKEFLLKENKKIERLRQKLG